MWELYRENFVQMYSTRSKMVQQGLWGRGQMIERQDDSITVTSGLDRKEREPNRKCKQHM